MSGFIDPTLLDALADFYPLGCRIERVQIGRGTDGAPAETWVVIHDNLKCSIAPPSGSERLLQYYTAENINAVIALKGMFPGVRASDRLVDENNVNYDIVSVSWSEFDSQTVLGCRRVEGI